MLGIENASFRPEWSNLDNARSETYFQSKDIAEDGDLVSVNSF